MRRYALVAASVAGAMAVVFALVEAIGVPILTDSEPLGTGNETLAAATIGVALLVADVFLPVPSSVIMVANGALFGVILGSALSMVGSVGAFAVGFGLGRRGTAAMARLTAEDERRRADCFFARWGVAAIILSRPVPILAETISFVAGTSVLSWRSALGSAVVGTLPVAVLYAIAGALAADFAGTGAAFTVVVVLAVGAAFLFKPERPVPDGSSS